MPKYIVKGKTYEIPDDKVSGFETKYPDAKVELHNDGKKYQIPLNKRDGFFKKYPNAFYGAEKPGSVSAQVIDEYDRYADNEEHKSSALIGMTDRSTPFEPMKGFGGQDVVMPMERHLLPFEERAKLAAKDAERADNNPKNIYSTYVNNKLKELDADIDMAGKSMSAPSVYGSVYGTAGGGRVPSASEKNKDELDNYNSLVAAKRQLEETNKIIEAAKHSDESFLSAVGRGFADKFFTVGNWDLGISDYVSASMLRDAVEKSERGEALSVGEERILDAAATNMAVQGALSGQLGRGYKAGATTGASIPFMLEMIANPISGAGNAMAKGLLKYGLKRFGRIATSKAAKVAGRLAGDAVAATGMAATTGIGHVMAGAEQRMTGDINPEIKDGEIKYGGRKNQIGALEAYGKSAADRGIENFSEMFFNAFSGGGKVAKSFIKEYAPVLARLPKTKVGELINSIRNQPMAKELANRTQFHGIIGEHAEEIVGDLLRVPMGEASMEDITNVDRNIDTFLGLAPTSVAFGMLGLGGMAHDNYANKRNLKRFEKGLNEDEKELFSELRERILNGNDEVAKNFIKATLRNPELTPEQKKSYIFGTQELVKEKAAEDVKNDPVLEEVNREEIEANKIDTYRNYKRAERKLGNQVPSDIIPALDEDMDVDSFAKEKGLNEQQVSAINEFLDARSSYNAYEHEVNRKRNEAAASAREQAANEVKKLAHEQRGTVIEAKIDGVDDVAHIVGGNISFDEDGVLDKAHSDDTIYYLDENGNKKMVSAENVSSVLSEIPSDELIETSIQQAIAQFDEEESASLETPDIPAPGKGERIMLDGSNYVIENVDNDMPGNFLAVKLNERGEIDPLGEIKSISPGDYYDAKEKELWGESEQKKEVAQEDEPIADSEAKEVEPVNMSEKEPKNETYPSDEESKVSEEPIEDAEQKKKRVIDSMPKKKDGAIDYDALTPQQQYEYTSVTESVEEAAKDLSDDISERRNRLAKMEEQLNKVTGTKKIKLRDAIREHRVKLDELETFYKEVVPAKDNEPADLRTDRDYIEWVAENSDDAKDLSDAYNAAKDLASHEQALMPWHKELLGRKINPESFYRFGDRNHVTGGLAKAWLNKKGEEIDTLAQELSTFGVEVMEQDIVDFMLANPSNHVSEISNDMRMLSARFSEVASKDTGMPIGGPESTTGKLYLKMKEAQVRLDALTDAQQQEFRDAVNTDTSYSVASSENDMSDAYEDVITEDYVRAYDDAMNERGSEEADEELISKAEEGNPELYYGGFTAEELDEIYSKIENGTERQETDSVEDGIEALSKNVPPTKDGGSEEIDRVPDESSRGENKGIELESGDNSLNSAGDSVYLHSNQPEYENDEVPEPIPQGEHRTEVEENGGLEEAANQLRRRIEEASRNASESKRSGNAQQEVNRSIESQAKDSGLWTPIEKISNIGNPFLSGNENDTYLNRDEGVVYKVNNLMSSGSLPNLFSRIDFHNRFFPETKYELVGFTGFGNGGSVYPIYKQRYIPNAEFASVEEIDDYMQSLGFRQTGEAKYSDGDIIISDLRPRNVLKDADGDIYVVDAEFEEEKNTSPEFAAPQINKGENVLDYATRIAREKEMHDVRQSVDTTPTEKQKEAGNYKKGHLKIDGYDVSIENPKGSERSGKDANSQSWSVTMNNDYGYIRGTEGVDGDQIDVFLSDNPSSGKVFVVDQVKEDGFFDEHKVMYGFDSVEEAREAYLANYSPGWKGLGSITEVSKDEFKKWVDSSKRKTKPFSEYKSVKREEANLDKDIPIVMDGEDVDRKELKEFHRKTDSTGRTQVIEEQYDEENLYMPLSVDGKPSRLGVIAVVPDSITDPSIQIAVYDYSYDIDTKTNSGWQKWGDLADEYNKTVSIEDAANERGDDAMLGFRSVDAAVKFFDWLKGRMEKEKQGKGDVRFREANYSEEEQAIIDRAKTDGTFMKAPNGNPTNLSEKQWVQVRTKAFKKWFGDWERAIRIDKLRKSKVIKISGEEYKGKYELNRDSAKAWMKDNLRGEYTIVDTKEKVTIGRKGVNKVTSHSMGSEAHLKSLAAVPQMLENAVFITEERAEKENAQYRSYRYYVVGVNIGGADYTAKLTIGVDENGSKFYDHALTEIEKGKLLDQINGQAVVNGFISTGAEPNPSVTVSKDSKLLSILQINSSKVVDENGEPMVVHHSTDNDFYTFSRDRLGENTDRNASDGGFAATAHLGFWFNTNDLTGFLVQDRDVSGYLCIKNPFEFNSLASLADELGSHSSADEFVERLKGDGYDGLVIKNDEEMGGISLVAFEPNQIKSATENNGEFSSEKDDIRYRALDRDVASFAQKHSLKESDVNKYAESMSLGSLGGAIYALKSMKRDIRLLNTGLSLGEFTKLFSPVKNELYERFGDVDALRDEYVKREMEKRNMMEAARKREEEKAAVERKRLEEFEMMTNDELDISYFKALEKKDETRMRDIINETARRKGYISSGEFRMAHRAPSYDEEGIDKNLVDIANNKDSIRESLNEQMRMNKDIYREESATAINAALRAIDKGGEPTVTIYRAVPKSLKEGKVRNGDWVSLSESYVKIHGEHALNGSYKVMKEEVPAENVYWDGNDINEWGYDDRSDYRYKNTKNNKKLNDLITRDDNGNVIPPSKRFNSRKIDERYRSFNKSEVANPDKVGENTMQEQIISTVEDLSKKLHTPIRIARSLDDVPEGAARRAIEKGRKIAGWFSPETGEVVVYMPNATSVEDVRRTVLHEVVGHKGLRGLLGEEVYDEIMMDLYKHLPKDVQKSVMDAAISKYGYSVPIAMDEYLAEQAETEETPSWWNRLVSSIRDALRNMGIDVGLTDNDVKYLLWKSRERLEKTNTEESNEREYNDADARYRTFGGNTGYVGYSLSKRAAKAKEEGRYPKTEFRKAYGLTPKVFDALVRAGVIYNSEWHHTSKYGNRTDFYSWQEEWMPAAYEGNKDAINIIIKEQGEERLGKLAELFENSEERAAYKREQDEKKRAKEDVVEKYKELRERYESEIKIPDEIETSNGVIVHTNGERNFFNWYAEKDGVRLTKRKGKNMRDAAYKQVRDILDSNYPAFSEWMKQQEYAVRFRENALSDGTRKAYEESLKGQVYKAQEAYQDSMLALKRLQDVIENHSGRKLKGFENAYIDENHLSSKSHYESEVYGEKFFKPMLEAVGALIKEGASYDDVVDYMMAKHGLERNEVFAMRDAENAAAKKYDKEVNALRKKFDEGELSVEEELNELIATRKDYVDSEFEKNRGKDYSGLTALTEAEDYEAAAKDIVSSFENAHDTADLWDKVNKATKESLRKSYESGMMSKATFDKVANQFKYYIPLRGWKEDTAADIYEYFNTETSSVNPVLKFSKGRKSLADDPIAVIGNMAESTILQGNRNLMKQKFMNMAINHQSDLLSVSEAWYVKDPSSGNWVLSYPNIEDGDSPSVIAQKVSDHEERMLEMKKDGNATKSNEGLSIDYRISKQQAKEHAVNVKRNGKDYFVYVNGNPRAAQAVNGLLNPDAENNKLFAGISRVNRQLAANFTTRNPAFVMTNLSRDLIFSTSNVLVKEDLKYSLNYIKNIEKSMRIVAGHLSGKSPNPLFEEFLSNGGETGYTALHNIDQYKRMIKKEMRSITGKSDYMASVKACANFFSAMNRWAEDVSRFNAYMTSREAGRSVMQSISDAKEVTVNFNKKGAGYKTGGVFGVSSGLMRNLFLFFNASVQSLANFTRLAANHKKGFGVLIGGFTTAGFITPMLNGLLISLMGGDDDYYGNLTEWERRNNLCIYAGGGKFIKLPLPIELRAFYGIGEMAYQETIGNGNNGESIAYDAINQIADLLPLNPIANNGDIVTAIMPDVIKPFWQINQNKDFTGKPIYRENDFNKTMPEWTKTYRGTSKVFVDLSEWLNELGGGDKYKSGGYWADWNPAKAEHVLESYFGGMATTIMQTGKTLYAGVESAMNGEKSDNLILRNVPVINRFASDAGDDKSAFSKVNSRYYRLNEEYEDTRKNLKGYIKEASTGDVKYLNKLSELQNSKEYEMFRVFEAYKKQIDKLMKMAKDAPGGVLPQGLEDEMIRLKKEAIEKVEKIQ